MTGALPLARLRHRAASGLCGQLAFAVRFAACLTLLVLLFELLAGLVGAGYLYPMAWLATTGLHLAGVAAVLDASTCRQGLCALSTPDQLFHIEHACTGVHSLCVYLAAVAAYPAAWARRGLGLLAGGPAFLLYGALRIDLLVVIGHVAPRALPLWHAHLMVLLNLGFLLCAWSVWVNHCARRPGAESGA